MAIRIFVIGIGTCILFVGAGLSRDAVALGEQPQTHEPSVSPDIVAQSLQHGGGASGDQSLGLRRTPPISDRRAEFLDDPYEPNVRPGGKLATTPAQIWVRGTFRSIQVNVDSAGRNIVGDAANEPSIAIDPTDPSKIVIGWRQFDTIQSNFRQGGWAYSHDWGETWTAPGVLEPQVFRSDPVLDSDAAGNFYYYSLASVTGGDMFISRDSGLSWEGPIPAFGGDKEWMVVDRSGGPGDGHVYVQWNRIFSCCDGDFTRSTDGGHLYSTPRNVPRNPFWGTMSVGPDGALYVSGAGGIVARSTNAQIAATVPTFDQVTIADLGGFTDFGVGPNPGGLLGQVWVATDHSSGPTRGNVYVLASVNPPGIDPLDVMFARSTDQGLTWSDPVRVNDDALGNGAWQWFGTMSVAPNGRIDVVWNDTRNSGAANISELYYSFSEDAGATWSVNTPVTPSYDSYVGWPQQNKMGDYFHMVSNETGANLAYAATFNGEQDVYFLRLHQDCNGNGVPDNEDIANGTSKDCNGNLLPDECEPDCNTNDTADDCDVTGGTSEDCNANRVPDECEADEDCNGNGVQDICDVGAGTSPDCNGNGTPDECEEDCNGSGAPDDCDIADGVSEDCDANGVPDTCDVAAGADCNGNSRPDDCDVAGFMSASPRLSLIGSWSPQSFTIPAPPVAISDVTLSFAAFADLGALNERIDVDINGASVGNVFATGASDCPASPNVDMIVVPGFFFNTAAADGVEINMVPTALVDPLRCTPDTYIEVVVTYDTALDCDGNGIPDECDPDCNGNDVPDACDIADATSVDCQRNGVPDECEADCDGNGTTDDCDRDTDGDGVIDACDPCPVDIHDDSDGDGVCDSSDECPDDPNKILAGQCGCGNTEGDDDGDGVANCNDQCAGVDDAIFAPQCADAIPTTSQWGLLILALLLLAGGKLYFGRYRSPTA